MIIPQGVANLLQGERARRTLVNLLSKLERDFAHPRFCRGGIFLRGYARYLVVGCQYILKPRQSTPLAICYTL